MHRFTAAGRTVCLFPGETPGAPMVWLPTFAEEGRAVWEAARAADSPPFALAAVSGLDWERDLSPWPAPAAFKSSPPFAGGADEFLAILPQQLMPAAEGHLHTPPCWHAIAGYSMAGLFAVYALYRTGLFARAGSISGSLWYPGMQDFVFAHTPVRRPDKVYFSLGAKERMTRHPLLQTVQDATQAIQTHYQGQGIETAFQLQPGGHHDHPARRTAEGICWLLR